MNNFITRITRLTVLEKGEPLFSEKATHIELDDEAAGELILIRQTHDSIQPGTISVDPTEWKQIKAAVDKLLSEIQP